MTEKTEAEKQDYKRASPGGDCHLATYQAHIKTATQQHNRL